MGGIFRSTSSAFVTFQTPEVVYLPAGFSLQVLVGYPGAAADMRLTVVDWGGTALLSNIALNALPADVILHSAAHGVTIEMTPAFLARQARPEGGHYTASLGNAAYGGTVMRTAEFQWGGDIDLLFSAAVTTEASVPEIVSTLGQHSTWLEGVSFAAQYIGVPAHGTLASNLALVAADVVTARDTIEEMSHSQPDILDGVRDVKGILYRVSDAIGVLNGELESLLTVAMSLIEYTDNGTRLSVREMGYPDAPPLGYWPLTLNPDGSLLRRGEFVVTRAPYGNSGQSGS